MFRLFLHLLLFKHRLSEILDLHFLNFEAISRGILSEEFNVYHRSTFAHLGHRTDKLASIMPFFFQSSIPNQSLSALVKTRDKAAVSYMTPTTNNPLERVERGHEREYLSAL